MFTFILIVLFTTPTLALAESVNVINTIDTSVSTGGNSANNGEIIEGKAKSRVKVLTEVNSKVLENFEKEFEGEGEFDFEFEKEAEGMKVETKIKINASSSNSNEIGESGATTTETRNFFRILPEKISNKINKLIKYVFSFFKF